MDRSNPHSVPIRHGILRQLALELVDSSASALALQFEAAELQGAQRELAICEEQRLAESASLQARRAHWLPGDQRPIVRRNEDTGV